MDNIILLDIDGVLINSCHWKKDEIHEDGYSDFNSECVKNFNAIVEKTGYDIVLISSRRISVDIEIMNKYFKNRGVNSEIKHYMPDYNVEGKRWLTRREELEMFLEEYKPNNYLIIDDDKSLLDAGEEIKSRWIQTDSMIGLKNYVI